MNDTTDANDLSHFSQQIVLRNGTPAVIRAIHPDDNDKVVAAFHKLDPQTIYTRFFSCKKELSANDLDRLSTTDFIHTVVLVAAIGAGADEIIIGGASYNVHAVADGRQVAEVAFTIEEDYQGQGLASKLLALLADIARHQGIDRFEAEVLAGNSPMLSVFQRSGFPMTRLNDDGVARIVLNLVGKAPAESSPGAGPKI